MNELINQKLAALCERSPEVRALYAACPHVVMAIAMAGANAGGDYAINALRAEVRK